MKTLYLECGMGAAGDMLTAALLELLPDAGAFVEKFNRIGIPGVELVREDAEKCGIHGTHVRMLVNGTEEDEDMHGHDDEEADHDHHHDHYHDDDHGHAHDHHHHHSSMHEIGHIISHLQIPEEVRKDILAVYQLIAEAESHAHHCPVEEIHFHEVGTMDAVADISAVCMLLHEIAPDRILASPVHVGCGTVRCAHGILPVPAPATAFILKNIPMYGGKIQGELCTPTGAALLKHFVNAFGDMPIMQTAGIGYGMGKKDFPAANCIRAFLGESADTPDEIMELSCNIDDMTAEEIAFACERLLEHGARDVYTVAAGMKKGRPGTLLNVITDEDTCEELVAQIFKHTTTLGIRKNTMQRYILQREIREVRSGFGAVHYKTAAGYGTKTEKIEYEDLAVIARGRDISLREARKVLQAEMGQNRQ
ncbi:MAG: nickel pincer cofactor biosynthesis protein LarC [Lachnospiraceae bacterium]|nr:nickel pincer cofactor biosynthesis protein LarC [Lachnospiraceae bacterium]